ncbi:MAG TPA: hypothetical protein DIT64_16885 [Verrucomicrobiales bacterium]|mgnify:CR=1 FL=1|nr:hypothetical protein [Verrucomicrobiales bacterium]
MLLAAQTTVDLIQSGGNPLFYFYEDLADVCARCSDAMQAIAFTLIFAGLLMQSYKAIMGGDLSGIMRHLVVSGILIAIMPHYTEWMLAAQSALGSDLLTALEVDPISTLINFGESFGDAPFETDSAPDIILGIFDPVAWATWAAQIVGLYCMIFISLVMYALFWCGFQLQIIIIYLGASVGPLFLAMLVFEPTRDTAVKYHVGLISVCFWPLGWGIGMLFTEAMMTTGIPQATALCALIFGPIMMEPTTATVISVGAVIIILLIIIVWMFVVLFAGPKIVSKAITTGAQIGLGFVNAAATAGMATATAGIQAASGAAMVAGGAAITAGTGGAGAAVGVGMMAGGAGTMGGAAGTLSKGVTSAGN